MPTGGIPAKLTALNDAFLPVDAVKVEYDDSISPALGETDVQGALDAAKALIAAGSFPTSVADNAILYRATAGSGGEVMTPITAAMLPGGYRTVATTGARDAIAAAIRAEGMDVYVQADQTVYRLAANLTTWNAVGGGGSRTVATVSAFAALSATIEGEAVYSQDIEDYFVYDSNASALTVDGITVLATVNGGTSRWIRVEWAHPKYRAYTAWKVDSTSGLDTNDGTPSNPIQTLGELGRRWGTVWNSIRSSTRATTVTIVGNPGTADAPRANIVLYGDQVLSFVGTPVQVRSGTCATYTAVDRATDTLATFTDGGVADWTSDRLKRIRITQAGARLNANAWSFGMISAIPRVNNFGVQTTYTNTVKVPLAGDTYDVETLPRINMGALHVQARGNSSSFTLNNVTFKDLDIGDDTTFVPTQITVSPGVTVNYLGCRIRTPLNQLGGYFFAIGCLMSYGFFMKSVYAYVYSCVQHLGGSAYSFSSVTDGASCIISQDTIFYTGGGLTVFTGGTANLGNVGFFNSQAGGGGNNPDGDGIRVGTNIQDGTVLAGGQLLCTPDVGAANSTVYGTGNVGVGLRTGSSSSVVVHPNTTMRVSGTGGDFRGGQTALSIATAIDVDTNGILSARNQNWANWAASRGSGGFGGAFINALNLARIVRTAV